MNIALVHDTLAERGGAEVAVAHIAYELSRKGHKVHVFVTRYEPALYSPKTRGRFQVHEIRSGRPLWNLPWKALGLIAGHKKQLLRAGKTIVDALNKGKYDLVVAFNFPSPWIVSAVQGNSNKMWYCQEPPPELYGAVTQREFDPFNVKGKRMLLYRNSARKLYRLLDQQIVPRLDMILVNSIFSSKLAEEVYALKSTVNYLGVDTESFSPHQSVLRKKLGLDECKIILLPARLHRVKCVDDIILATEKIVKHEDKVKTIIIGTGPEELSLKRMTRELGLTSNVLFWGDTVNSIVPQHYGMADVVVNLSLYEPFGLVPVEGMACGKPVVVYDSGGPAETVLDRVTGVKVKPRDVGHLSDEILAIIQNPRRGREMGLRGRERVLGNYTWELTAKRLLQTGESS